MRYPQFRVFVLFAMAVMAGGCGNSRIEAEANRLAAGEPVSPTPAVSPTRELDVPYVPTPTEVVDEMLAMAEVKGGDVLYDLGSGDGRIPITAAKKFGTRGVGIDIDPARIREATANAESEGVANRVTFTEGDIFEADFSEATVVTLYLLPDVNLRLRPKILEMKPGTRVVSHNYDMGSWTPEKTKTITVDGRDHFVYFWRVPEKGEEAK